MQMHTLEESFFEKVHNLVRKIPKGRVCTYGAIAKYLGAPQSARMVGWAMHAAHRFEDIPAHRVVNRIGMLTGKHQFKGTNRMQELLEIEGVAVQENQVVNFNTVFWNPQKLDNDPVK